MFRYFWIGPDRLSDVRPQEQVQRHNVEQLVDSPPVVPSLDAPVPLMAEQLVDVLSLVAKYEKEMDRLEDLILTGAPVSAADKEAWRRWVNRSSSSSGAKRKKKKRRKRKLPKAGGRAVLGQVGCHARCCATTRLGERSWCASATDHGRCGEDSACACLRGADRGVPVPQIMEVFFVPQITEEIVEVIQPGTRVSTCSLLCNDKCLGRQSRKLWKFHSCSLLEVVQSLDKVVDTPAGVQRHARGPDCAENRGVSAVAALDGFVPGDPGSFRALDDEEFFVIEGSLGVALTPEFFSQVLGLR